MRIECIDSIDITTNNKDVVSISSSNFDHFYISNIDSNGEEINYQVEGNKLYASFFMIRILNDKDPRTYQAIDRLLNKPDVVNVRINFTNGNTQEFDIAKKRVQDNGKLINKYEDVFLDKEDNNLCILISDKNLKYKKELFA